MNTLTLQLLLAGLIVGIPLYFLLKKELEWSVKKDIEKRLGVKLK